MKCYKYKRNNQGLDFEIEIWGHVWSVEEVLTTWNEQVKSSAIKDKHKVDEVVIHTYHQNKQGLNSYRHVRVSGSK